MAIRLLSTGKAAITLRGGEVPARAGAPFEVDTEAQAERLVRKGYATRPAAESGGQVKGPEQVPMAESGPEVLAKEAPAPRRGRSLKRKGEG